MVLITSIIGKAILPKTNQTDWTFDLPNPILTLTWWIN